MAARVTADEVKEIMEDSTIDNSKIDAMILAGDLIITKVFSEDTTTGTDLIKEIERWFIAHMLSATLARTTTDEGIGDVRIKYAGIFGEGLKATPYGQMVLTLDVTGKMARTGKLAPSLYAIPTIKTTDDE